LLYSSKLKWRQTIGPVDTAGIVLSVLAISLLELVKAGGYWARAGYWLDNRSYLAIAGLIRGVGSPQAGPHFWGFPLVIAGLQALLRVSGLQVLVAVSIVCSLLASYLIRRLYGDSVTVAFWIVSPAWVRLSVLGGSEPLFLCLLLLSWTALRSKSTRSGTLLAALATTVRPVGFIAICAIAFTLLLRRDWRGLAATTGIALATGLAYLALVKTVSGDAFINFKRYSASDWPSGNPLTIPFLKLGKGAWRIFVNEHWSNSGPLFLTLALVIAAVVVLAVRAEPVKRYPAEFWFVAGYLAFLACYAYSEVSFYFPRFAIPALPFLLFVLRDWLPSKRLLVWPLAILSALFTVVNLLGFKAAFGFSRHG
jgi:hypothetical protein